MKGDYRVPLYSVTMHRQNKGDGIFKQPTVRFETSDPDRLVEKIEQLEKQGYVATEVVEEKQTLIRMAMRKADKELKGGPDVVYDPATRANKPSGMGMKPYGKVYYEKDKPQRGAWVPFLSPSPRQEMPSTKRLPSQQGKKG